MDNKLSELSKPVGFAREEDIKLMQSGKLLSGLTIWRSGKEPLYSQEYVSALLAELEAKDKRIAELEAKLATPVRLTDERTLWVGEDDYDAGHVKGWNANRIEQAALLKKQGFKVEGDE
ncbi:TPA: hypothetical protein SLN25_001459 [Serratia marcescens]|nr:hypothetical protein [Serratia marcescens]